MIVATLVGIGTAFANANGVFSGHPRVYLWIYGAALIVFLFGIALHFSASNSGEPRIIPLRYDKGPSSPYQNASGQWCRADGVIMSTADVLRAKHWINRFGLVFQNIGECAFEVAPVNFVPVGTSKLVFEGHLSNWAQENGEGFFPINMERRDKSGLLGGLFEEMKDHNIVSVPITIKYRNSKGCRYRTTCEIERDVTSPHGLTVVRVRHGRDLFGILRRK